MRRLEFAWVVSIAALAVASPARAQTDAALARDDRIAELERTVRVLADELERTREQLTVPEQPRLKSAHGLGPAASKVYQIARGLSIGGYGEANYTNIVSDAGSAVDRADYLRSVLYVGYKFSERILFNSEYELEHATTGSTVSASGGSFSVELATLDFLIRDWANARAGLLLVPMGFLNEVHEPPFFYGTHRPEVERRIIPTTWREIGAGLFGNLGESVSYSIYGLNGFNAEGYRPSGLRGGRQKGNRVLAEDLAVVARMDWIPHETTLLGGSVYHGDAGQSQNGLPDAATTIFEAHGQYESHGLHLRGLFTMAHVGDAGRLTRALGPGGTGDLAAGETVARTMLGAYGEVAYDVLPLLFPQTDMSLSPFYRFEWLDTQHDVPSGFSRDRTQETMVNTIGISFKPIPNVVIKSDYRNLDSKGGDLPDEFNLGIGFVF